MPSLFVALLMLSGIAARAAQPVDPTPTTHKIVFHSVLAGHHCSATAIGPYALLTASHCEAPSDYIYVDDHKVGIVQIERDDADHSIYYLDLRTPFTDFAKVSTSKRLRGSTVIVVGNPGDAVNLYRQGQYSGELIDDDNYDRRMVERLFNFPSAPGDSGQGIFDETGTLFDVESAIANLGSEDAPMWVPMAYPLHFTAAQLVAARQFHSDTAKDKPKQAAPSQHDDPNAEGQYGFQMEGPSVELSPKKQ